MRPRLGGPNDPLDDCISDLSPVLGSDCVRVGVGGWGSVRTPADLRRTFLALDHVFFGDMCSHAGVRSRWSKFRGAKNSFTFGVFDSEKLIVSLNVRLAQPDVPDFVVSAVCYHEMLHFAVGLEHDVAFARAEHLHPYYYDSETWCDKHVLENL